MPFFLSKSAIGIEHVIVELYVAIPMLCSHAFTVYILIVLMI